MSQVFGPQDVAFKWPLAFIKRKGKSLLTAAREPER